MVNKGGGSVIQVHNGSDYLIAACAAGGRVFISAGNRMFFRTESLSAGAVGAPAATIVNAAAKAIGAAFAGLFGRHGRRLPETLMLSEHDLRDIGLDQHVGGQPIPYDLLDLMPRGLTIGHRRRR
ncbi:MAG TPA: hypothetical protein VG742_02245 [Dongiaceae bacterium]|nr:hypothetical protein [Dongiaceae bacterium]